MESVASKKGSVKVAYDLRPDVKHRLSVLKADLRLRGLPATETGIIEVLIETASQDGLYRALRKRSRP